MILIDSWTVAVLPVLAESNISTLPKSFSLKTIQTWEEPYSVVFPWNFDAYSRFDILVRFIEEIVDEQSVYQQFGYKEFKTELYFVNDDDALIYKLYN